MTLDDSLLKQLIETFSSELESLISVIINNLQKIQKNTPEAELNQIAAEISRSGRNIKVSALSIGIDDLGAIAECIEKLFMPTEPISPEVVTLTHNAVEGMRESLGDFIAKKQASITLRELIHQLRHQARIADIEEKVAEEKVASAVPVFSESTSEREFLKKIVETFKSELQENLMTITNGLLQLEKRENSEDDRQHLFTVIFRAAHNIKGSARSIGAIDVGEIAHQIETLFAEIQQKRIEISPEIIDLCLQSIDFMNEAMRCYSEDIPSTFDLQGHLNQLKYYTEHSQAELPQAVIEPPQGILAENTKTLDTRFRTGEFESIRVSLQNLDRISADMEELQAIKIIIDEYYSDLIKINYKIDYFVHAWKKNLANVKTLFNEDERFNALFSTPVTELTEINNSMHTMQRALRTPINELSTLLGSLQDEVRRIRLIPVDAQLRYLPRVVRDLAHGLKKQVNFDIINNDVKIDKMILDGLKDPIVHLLRNAIDHGIERPETRQAVGKSAQGNILIEVRQEDHQIIFEISDDGAGINPEALLLSALKKNIISPVELEGMNPEAALDLIFRPGFSTRDIATDISGRGVGLDVVRSNLAQLKGQVTVTSQFGKGTHFRLQVPITLVTERGLIISCSDQLFVLITRAVDCVFLLKSQDIIEVEGSPAVLVNQQPILLCSLSKVLHLNEKIQEKEYFSVVVIHKDQERIALLVDEIIGEREIVLKPLQEPLTNIPCVTGATLSGSNQINFVLNSAELIKKALF
ncbi:chemotaxis protein CheA [Legionella rowbothamii]|uniref:chemotaxis protein CheA n=1 Tax=Legionella rowbothamii TaxID=96229 RepID=UPI0010546914|nr:chemotaxis protein CheA [Legionella rowbothamii]